MTNYQLVDALSLHVFEQGEEREVSTGYCGDLLSWVMGRAPQDSAWITVMSNNNVAAVAVLCDVSCIILAQGSQPDEVLLARAQREGICLLGSERDAYTLCAALAACLGGEDNPAAS